MVKPEVVVAQEGGSRFSKFVGLKLRPEEFRELRLLASLRGVTLSEVLRSGLKREVEAAVTATPVRAERSA